MLMPKGHWKWYVDEQSDCLAIELDDDLLFHTSVSRAKLLLTPDQHAFSIEQLQCYTEVHQELDDSGLAMSDALKVQIALNAVAVTFYAQKPSVKSWYFKHQPTQQLVDSLFQTKPLAWIESESDSALLLVLEMSEQTSCCMVLSEQFELTSSKIMSRFSLLSVHTNRLRAFEQPQSHKKRA